MSAPCLGAGRPVRGQCLPRPGPLPAQKLPSPLLFRNRPSRESAGKQRRGGPAASEMQGASSPPLCTPWRKLRTRARRSGNPCFPTWLFLRGGGNFAPGLGLGAADASRGEGWALLLRPRSPRIRHTPLASGYPRSQSPPRSLWKRFPGCMLVGQCSPLSPAAVPSAGCGPLALTEWLPVLGLWCSRTAAAARLPAKRRHPKRCR